MSDAELQAFLEDAFSNVGPIGSEIGAVHVAPKYGAPVDYSDKTGLPDALTRAIQDKFSAFQSSTSSKGVLFQIDEQQYPLLGKYILTVTFYRKRFSGFWIQVEPPDGVLRMSGW